MVDAQRRRTKREEEVDRRRGPVHVEEDEAKLLEDDEEVSFTLRYIWNVGLMIDIPKINGPSTSEGTTECPNIIRTRKRRIRSHLTRFLGYRSRRGRESIGS
jgi:hypothetical protein